MGLLLSSALAGGPGRISGFAPAQPGSISHLALHSFGACSVVSLPYRNVILIQRRNSGFEFDSHRLPALCPCTSLLTSLRRHFLTSKKDMVVVRLKWNKKYGIPGSREFLEKWLQLFFTDEKLRQREFKWFPHSYVKCQNQSWNPGALTPNGCYLSPAAQRILPSLLNLFARGQYGCHPRNTTSKKALPFLLALPKLACRGHLSQPSPHPGAESIEVRLCSGRGGFGVTQLDGGVALWSLSERTSFKLLVPKPSYR